VLANPNGPTVIWLQGSGCTGCTESFLNLISTSDPKTAADVLINSINLTYHPNLMALAGDSAVAQAQKAYTAGGYVLVPDPGYPVYLNATTVLNDGVPIPMPFTMQVRALSLISFGRESKERPSTWDSRNSSSVVTTA
jgi:hydrogenase small subunit